MQHHQIRKLENPDRIQELDPVRTLLRIGLRDGLTMADIGAGSGVFAMPAARITSGMVHVLEISDEMLEYIAGKAKNQNIANIELIKVESDHLDLVDHSVDIALMATVMHELPDRGSMLAEVKRILKEAGRLAVIEFHKRDTPMGPPPGRRLDQKALADDIEKRGFVLVDSFELGENMYCLVLEAESSQ
ncbi:MAG: methyltransferase domain-containing protein [Syntrophomonadaceae bacterium]